MAYDEQLAERVRSVLAGQPGITERKMFGGLCFMVHGNMCLGVEKDRLMVRVGPHHYDDALSEPHARVMDFTGKPLRGFVFVSPEGIQADAELMQWAQLGLDFAGSLPAK